MSDIPDEIRRLIDGVEPIAIDRAMAVGARRARRAKQWRASALVATCVGVVALVVALRSGSEEPVNVLDPSSSTAVTQNTAAATTSAPATAATTPLVTPMTAIISNCAFWQLHVTFTGNSGMGHIGVVLVFTNTSADPCTLIGYPGVAGLDAGGQQVIQAERSVNGYVQVLPPGQAPPLVILGSRESASAFVEGTDVPVGPATSCPSYPKLLVTPPNTSESVTIEAAMPGCTPVQVHPVVPGTTGQDLP